LNFMGSSKLHAATLKFSLHGYILFCIIDPMIILVIYGSGNTSIRYCTNGRPGGI